MDDDGNSLKYADYLTYAKKFIITKEHFYDLKTSNDDEKKTGLIA